MLRGSWAASERRGFTMIEVIGVLAIIALLAVGSVGSASPTLETIMNRRLAGCRDPAAVWV